MVKEGKLNSLFLHDLLEGYSEKSITKTKEELSEKLEHNYQRQKKELERQFELTKILHQALSQPEDSTAYQLAHAFVEDARRESEAREAADRG